MIIEDFCPCDNKDIKPKTKPSKEIFDLNLLLKKMQKNCLTYRELTWLRARRG